MAFLCVSQQGERKNITCQKLLGEVHVKSFWLLAEKVERENRQNVTDWTGGQQPGFSSLNYVLK
jgi:hypothetical protein